MYLKSIKKYKPDIILGLGQCGSGKKIRIERKAINRKRFGKKERPKPIFKKRPKYYFLNLKLKKDRGSRISYNAGDYVCNYSMYVISNFIRKKNIKFAFVHIPRNYNLNKAVKFVESKIHEIFITYLKRCLKIKKW